MRTDTGSVGFHRDAELPEVRRGPDAGAEQDSWRPVGPPREDDQPPAHLPPVGEAHACRAAARDVPRGGSDARALDWVAIEGAVAGEGREAGSRALSQGSPPHYLHHLRA